MTLYLLNVNVSSFSGAKAGVSVRTENANVAGDWSQSYSKPQIRKHQYHDICFVYHLEGKWIWNHHHCSQNYFIVLQNLQGDSE